jgi:hypothetical protein
MSRFTSIATAVLLTSLAACDDDSSSPPPGPTPPVEQVKFSELNEAERVAAIVSASGFSGALAGLAVFQASIDNAADASCPARSDDGPVTTYTASGCTGKDSGERYQGKAIAQNWPLASNPEHFDPNKPMALTFEDFSAGEVFFDGTLVQSAAEPNDGYTTGIDLTTRFGGEVHVKLVFECTPAGCRAQDGAAGTIPGKGGFTISATTVNDAEGILVGGVVELRGEDVLRIDLGVEDDDGCTPYTIDGQVAGKICNDDETDEPDDTDEPLATPFFVGSGLACSDVDLTASVYISEAVINASVTLVSDGRTFTAPLVETGDIDDGVSEWSATLPVTGCDLDKVSVRYSASWALVFEEATLLKTSCLIRGDASVFPDAEACTIE